MTPSPTPEVLIPEAAPGRVPWHSHALFDKPSRKQRWWTELDHREMPKYRVNKYPIGVAAHKEDDRDWYDSVVEDGTSMIGPYGLDSTAHRNLELKTDQPGNFYEFQKKVMKGSIHYKQMAEKFKLSEEHPGIDVGSMASLTQHEPRNLGKANPHSLWHLGPRYWDKPINEGCFGKGLALAKYAAIGSLPTVFFQFQQHKEPFRYYPSERLTLRLLGSFYLRAAPVPCLLAFSYGAGLCTSASLRNKDDFKNFFVASGIMSATLFAAKENMAFAAIAFLVSSFVGSMYHWCRIDSRGFRNKFSTSSGGTGIGGPLLWKSLAGKNTEIPERTHF